MCKNKFQLIFYLSLCLIFLLYVFNVFSQEKKDILKPNKNAEEIKISSGYFGLEMKWSVINKINSNISVKTAYMDPEILLSYIEYESNKNSWSLNKKEEENKKALKLLNDYLIFKVWINENRNNKNTDSAFIKDVNWNVRLIDDLENEYYPKKIEKKEIELRRGGISSYYQQIINLYFPKYKDISGKPILCDETKWLKIELTSGKTKTQEFEWIFSEDMGSSDKEKISYSNIIDYFAKIILLIVLFLSIILYWKTRPHYK